jgi:hypothetical protein
MGYAHRYFSALPLNAGLRDRNPVGVSQKRTDAGVDTLGN